MHTLVVCILIVSLVCSIVHKYTLFVNVKSIWHGGAIIEEQIRAWGCKQGNDFH